MNPIKIMDEIERDLSDLQAPGADKMLLKRKVKSLRAAIDAQTEARRLVLRLATTLWAHDPSSELISQAQSWLDKHKERTDES